MPVLLLACLSDSGLFRMVHLPLKKGSRHDRKRKEIFGSESAPAAIEEDKLKGCVARKRPPRSLDLLVCGVGVSGYV